MSQRTNDKLDKLLQEELTAGEVVTHKVYGLEGDATFAGTPVVVALTNQRLVAVIKDAFKVRTASWGHQQVTAVGTSAGARYASLVFTLPGDGFRCGRVPKAEATAFRHAVEAVIAR